MDFRRAVLERNTFKLWEGVPEKVELDTLHILIRANVELHGLPGPDPMGPG